MAISIPRVGAVCRTLPKHKLTILLQSLLLPGGPKAQSRWVTASARDYAKDGATELSSTAPSMPKLLHAAKGKVQVEQDPRRPKSVGELHALHCDRLAFSASTTEAEWQWASLRACKLAEGMRPMDLAMCVASLARARRRDMRLLFMLAEQAIVRRKEFGAQQAAGMLEAYAELRVRNEPLFEAMGMQLATLAAAFGFAKPPTADSACGGAADVDIGRPTTIDLLASSLEAAVSAHRTLDLEHIPTFLTLDSAAQLAQSVLSSSSGTCTEVLGGCALRAEGVDDLRRYGPAPVPLSNPKLPPEEAHQRGVEHP